MKWLFLLFIVTVAYTPPQDRPFVIDGFAQGTTYHILYFAGDSIVPKPEIDSIFIRIDSSLSLY